MLRPMAVGYELFFLGVDGSSYHVVREVDLDGISGSILLCVNYLGIDLSCCLGCPVNRSKFRWLF